MKDDVTEVRANYQGSLLVVTLDGPSTRNAIGPDVYTEIRRHLLEAEQVASVRAIVLTGANGFFSSGGNVRALKASGQTTLAGVSGNTDKLNATIKGIRGCPKPVIAAIEGGASGAGFSMCLACDMIVASETANFTAAYVRVGLTPDGGATHFLRGALPAQLVNEICMLGLPIPAPRLASAGVVNRLAPEGRVLDAALELAGGLANGPANALCTIKRLVGAAEACDLATQLEDEARSINLARFGPEAAEGLSAFLEKRRPDFVSLQEEAYQ
ncbi:enoyl-CoA hydratase [Aquicoccus porphyridii]|uniref:Enoyl-CoA hydratase n=1 Tax=Aquicoccus porphyridii TaxID=1852029 RepID=A0A5A9ZCV4_9RHOB|nr:enoyl-CoA hydratase family protein [Aquicoccus porphyridii]KAA0914990.1 enoyl-CoA hydratase [Aquicoccus porphyridii]RAI52637.1 enoyl-CoA hydratase [Rhodobacteraceae bacterium AsT-22]